jgi:hypothetical protein
MLRFSMALADETTHSVPTGVTSATRALSEYFQLRLHPFEDFEEARGLLEPLGITVSTGTGKD